MDFILIVVNLFNLLDVLTIKGMVFKGEALIKSIIN